MKYGKNTMLDLDKFKPMLKQKFAKGKKMDGKSRVEEMKRKIRAKLAKKHGGSMKDRMKSIKEKLAAKASKTGDGASKVESAKARIRELIKKRNSER